MMKNYSIAKSLNNAELWLLGIGSSLIAINLTVVFRHNPITSIYINFLFLITICILVKEKRHNLNLESGIFSSCLGTFLLVLVFLNSTFQINAGIISLFLPLISAFGLALLASGFKGLKQYRKELLLLGFLGIRSLLVFVRDKIDISLISAKLSTAILWYTGFEVNRSGIMINLPTGSVEVYNRCAGIDIITDLLTLAVLFIFLFNLSLQQKFIVPIVAATLAFIVNGFRIALMAILAAQGDKQAFEYWHEADGSLLFSMIATLFFGCFCWFLLSRNERKNQNTRDNLS